MKMSVYADNAATTAVSDEVLNAMLPYFKEEFGNPSSVYQRGAKAKAAIDMAREQIAKELGASANEIYFTSGGTESDNWAIFSVAQKFAAQGKKHIITTKFEHHAVLHPCQKLEKQGYKVTYLDVYENGIVKPEDLENAITDETCLVTIMYANNEIGTVQPIAKLGAICKKHSVLFHTDAVQAVGKVPINVKEQNIDLLSLSGHKIHAPKGVGALYIKKGLLLPNILEGGAQERNRRPGTENVASIVALGEAIEIACANMEENNRKISMIADKIIEEASKIERSRLNGDRYQRLAGTVNMCFEGIEGEALLLMLDLQGISASSGSACTSGSLDPSHVLLSLGLPHEIAHGSLRLSFSEDSTMKEAEYILECLPKIIDRLRQMSPLWDTIKKNEQ